MPFNLAGHCTVHIGGDLFLIAGGFHKDYKSPSDKVFLQVRWVIFDYLLVKDFGLPGFAWLLKVAICVVQMYLAFFELWK